MGPEAYYMGIIDFLQEWNWNKRAERFFKINFRGADPDGLSAIEPEIYRDRFIRRMEELLDMEESELALARNNDPDAMRSSSSSQSSVVEV